MKKNIEDYLSHRSYDFDFNSWYYETKEGLAFYDSTGYFGTISWNKCLKHLNSYQKAKQQIKNNKK